MALLFEFSDIANLMTVASLLAYSMVSFSVLVLKWDPATPWSGGLGSWGWWGGHLGLCHAAFLFKRRKKWNRQSDVVWIAAAVNIAFKPLIQVPARSENLSKNEKTEEETEMEPVLEGSPLDSVPEAGTLNILKSLWFPTSTTPTQKSAQIVYGCAFLLGEQWGFPLFIFWNWLDGVRVCILSVE